MSITDYQEFSTPPDWPFESDLPSIACQAAIELDNMLLDRPIGADSVRQLASLIARSIPIEHDPNSSNWLFDPSAFVVVNEALSDARSRKPIESVSELVRETGEIVQRMQELVANPRSFSGPRAEELKAMRSFCLALSRRASETAKSPEDSLPEHPFRR